MAIKQRRPLSLSSIFQIQFFLKPSLNIYAFLRFATALLLLMLLFEIILDLTLDLPFINSHIALKIAVYFSIFMPNGALLIFIKNNPCKHLIFLSTFIIISLLLRLLLSNTIGNLSFDFDWLPFCLFLFPAYTVFTLLIPNSKYRILLVFLQQITIFLFLNLKWTLNICLNLKLLMSIIINFAIFFKLSAFSLQRIINTTKEITPPKKVTKTDLKSPTENDWRGLIDDIPQGIILLSHEKNVLYTNKCSLELLDIDSFTISSKKPTTLFQNIVSKLGKMEEIQSYSGNSDEIKPAEHGFTILESSLSGRKSNSHKRTFLGGVNPVNIFNSNLSNFSYILPSKLKITSPGPATYVNHFFGANWTKEKIALEKNNDDDAGNRISPNVSLGEKVMEKSEKNMDNFIDLMKLKKEALEAFNFSGIDENGKNVKKKSNSEIQNPEKNLDEILDKMISNANKTLKIYYSEISEINDKKLELKIKRITFENSPAFLLTIQDVSYLKVFQQVCENNEYKNKVLTTLSHELRTPLNGALIPLEKLLNESLENSAENFEGLDIAYKSIILLQNVLNDVVDFALINSNQLYLNYEELDMNKFLDNIVDLFRRQAQEKGLFLDLIINRSNKIPKTLKTDFQRLGQILVSLLNNSMKNTFEGGIAVHVDVLEKPEVNLIKSFLKITIEDTGVGIKEPKLSNIKKCLKSKDLLKVCENLNKNQGCGLGLVISHCLALLLGPTDSKGLHVSCKSRRGASIYFYLEIKENDHMEIIEETAKDIKTSPTNKTSPNNNRAYYTFCNSVADTSKKRKERASQINFNEINDLDIEHNVCESERSSKEMIGFLRSHTIQTKKMMEISCNFCEVLIVDDDSFNLMALEVILSKYNLKSVKAFNGQQAIDKILERFNNFPKSQVFSMVFLDYHMPIKNGMETTVEINKMFQEDGLIKFPIIACTAFGAKDLVEQWSHAGVSDFVIKPISFQKIEGLLRNFEVLK